MSRKPRQRVSRDRTARLYDVVVDGRWYCTRYEVPVPVVSTGTL
jgi:hypothetical protein